MVYHIILGGASRNPAPRNHFLVRIVKPSGSHCTDAYGGNKYPIVPTPLRSTSPFSDSLRFTSQNGQTSFPTYPLPYSTYRCQDLNCGLARARRPTRNPVPRNHFLVWILKPSGCHCTDGRLTRRVFTED